MDRLGKEELLGSKGKGGFQVPEGYFETLPGRLAEQLPEREVRVRKLWTSPFVGISAAAAVIAFLLLLIPSQGDGVLQFEDLSGDTIAEYLQGEAMDLDSYDLAESLPLGDIAMDDVMDKMPGQQQIVDYLEYHMDTNDELYLDRDE